MKRVLFDENIPRKLRHDLVEFDVRTVQEQGWAALTNGELLRAAQGAFSVLLTADKRLRSQQDLSKFNDHCYRETGAQL